MTDIYIDRGRTRIFPGLTDLAPHREESGCQTEAKAEMQPEPTPATFVSLSGVVLPLSSEAELLDRRAKRADKIASVGGAIAALLGNIPAIIMGITTNEVVVAAHIEGTVFGAMIVPFVVYSYEFWSDPASTRRPISSVD